MDGTRSGEPSDLTRRRWKNFGISGAKLMWGGEAVAIRHDGRANPHQLMLTPGTQTVDRLAAGGPGSARIASASGRTPTATCISGCRSPTRAGLRVLTVEHSGAAGGLPPSDSRQDDSRWRPGADRRRYRSPDRRLCRGGEARRRLRVSVRRCKACHGYLGHELLGATTRDQENMAGRWKTGCASSPR